MTARELMTAARMEDFSFTDTRHTDRVLRPWLAAYQRELVGKVAWAAPEELAEQVEILLPFASFADGAELVEEAESGDEPLQYTRILPTGEAVRGGRLIEFRLMAQIGRGDGQEAAAGWIRNRRLYLVGEARDWSGVTAIRLYYVPLPPLAITDESDILMGDLGYATYVAFLAAKMAARNPKEAQRSLREFQETHQRAEHELIRDLLQRHVGIGRTREVW
jgi:hypothetical protein